MEKPETVPPILIEQLTEHTKALFIEAQRALGMLRAFAPVEAQTICDAVIQVLSTPQPRSN